MSSESSGAYTVLVVQIRHEPDGAWRLIVDGAGGSRNLTLTPAVLVLRVWRSDEHQLLRGTVRLRDGPVEAPFQSNQQLEALLQAWLFGPADHTPAVSSSPVLPEAADTEDGT